MADRSVGSAMQTRRYAPSSVSGAGALAALLVACSEAPDATPAADAGASELTWTVAAPCPVARFEANTAVVGNELWVMGGFTSTELEVTRRVDIYNPEQDTWRQGPDLPDAETHLAVAVVGSDIIVAGGFSGAFMRGSRLPTTDAVWRYRASTGAWEPGPALPVAGAAFAWALLGTELHLAGGLGPDGDTDAVVHHVWSIDGAAAWSAGAPFPVARNHGGGAATGGIFYAIAGRYEWDEVSGSVVTVNAFDPTAGTWSERAPIPGSRSEIGAATFALADGRIVVVGGSVTGKFPSDDVLAYDPAKNEWSALPLLPEKRKGAVAARLGKRLVVTTGSPTSTDPSATTFVACCL